MSSLAMIRQFVERALNGIEKEPIAAQIDIHQAAADLILPYDKDASDVAAHTAGLLREAERNQLKFRDLLRS